MTTDITWHLELFVPGKPAPQGSKHARPIYRGKGAARVFTGKVVNLESSKAGVDAWRGDVRAACLDTWGSQPPLDGPLVLEVEFIRKRPAAAPKSYTPDATTAPDLSKLVRSTEDAITSAGIWADDARVVRTVSSKRCAEIGETPGAHIRIGSLTPARDRWAAQKSGAESPGAASNTLARCGDPSQRGFASDTSNQQANQGDFWATPPGPPHQNRQNQALTPTPWDGNPT